jgi:hypothetical protein
MLKDCGDGAVQETVKAAIRKRAEILCRYLIAPRM